MKRLTFLFFAIASMSFGQTLSLDSCIQMAKRNYPLIKQNQLISENGENTEKMDTKNWLPRLSLNGKANYQSETIEFLGKSFPHDSYVAAMDLEQTVFDGNVIHQQKKLDALSTESDLIKNEVELYKLIDRINQLYSSILLNRESIKTLNTYKDDIGNKKGILSSSVQNGLSLQSNLDALEVEELKTEQNLIEGKANMIALYQTLGMFVNKAIDDNTILSVDPLQSTSKGDEINRPELKLMETQKSMLDARYQLSKKNTFPKIAINGEGAYGRPGPNFLNQDVRFFSQAGITLKWNIAALYNLSNAKQNYTINKQMVDVQKEVFEFNVKTAMLSQTEQINSLKEIIEKDKLIIEKRKSIKESYASQLANGSITSTDYLVEANAEMQAILNQKVHEIKLMIAISNYNMNKGINNF